MNIEKIEQLVKKYDEGQTSLEEEVLLREFFRSDEVPDSLKSYKGLFDYYEGAKKSVHMPSDVDPFAKIDFDNTNVPADDAQTANSPAVWWSLRIAAGLILLLTGFSAGLIVQQQRTVSDPQVAALQQEIQQMRNALVYGSYQQASASERISAVNLSARFPKADDGALDRQISEILIYTMNNDKNVNVRQAAAEALFRFRGEPDIRKALVHSLERQSDPLMQITLIDMLVKMKEKTAVNEMQKLLMNTNTQEVVKDRLQAGIAELKT